MTVGRSRSLLLAVTLAFLAQAVIPAGTAQEVSPDFVITDSVGDVKPTILGVGQAPTPDLVPLPPTDNVDITAIRVISEDATRLMIAIEMQDLSSAVRNTDAQDLLSYRFDFRLDSSPVVYEFFWSAIGLSYIPATNPEDEPRQIWDSMCLRGDGSSGTSSCAYQEAFVYLDLGEDRFLIEIPKDSLLGRNPIDDDQKPPPGTPKSLPVGTGMTGWQFAAAKRGIVTLYPNIVVWLEDRAPNDAPSEQVYEFQVPSANTVVRLVGPTGETAASSVLCQGICFAGGAATTAVPDASVTPGQESRIPITVHNQASTKRLVNLTVRMEESAPEWRFQLAPGIEVPGGKSRTVSLLVNASTAVTHKDAVRVFVEGRSLGHPEELGQADLVIAAAVTPSPTQQTLYFHLSGHTPDEALVDACVYILTCSTQFDFWLNTLEDDEAANLDEEGYEDFRAWSFGVLPGEENVVFRQFFTLDTPLARGIYLDTSQPASMTLRLSAPRDMAATVRASVGLTDQASCPSFTCGSYVPLAEGAASGTITSDETFTVSLPINPEFARVKADDGRLAVYIEVATEDPTAVLNQADGVVFHPKGSQVTLPVTVDPEADDGGSGLIGVYRASDAEEFLNPGKTRAFHVLVANEGVDADRIELTTESDQDGWEASFRPAARYELTPGSSVNVTMLVTAPETAKEGDRATIDVRATSLNHTDSFGRVQFVAIATTGVQIEDESESYAVDEEASERVYEEDGAESPGLPILALLAGLGVAVALRRRC